MCLPKSLESKSARMNAEPLGAKHAELDPLQPEVEAWIPYAVAVPREIRPKIARDILQQWMPIGFLMFSGRLSGKMCVTKS